MNIPDSVIEAAKAACDKCNGRDTWDDTVLAMLTAALTELEKTHAVVPRTDTPAIQALIAMGKKYIPHSDMCGCERCAAQADNEVPRQVFDVIEDVDFLNCGCPISDGCGCTGWDDWDYEP